MKDVVSCDKPRRAANEHYIRGFPNGTTWYCEAISSRLVGKPTRGTETSKYPEEKKTIVIPQVVASEQGTAQTQGACSLGVVGLHLEIGIKQKLLERSPIEGDRPVSVHYRRRAVS